MSRRTRMRNLGSRALKLACLAPWLALCFGARHAPIQRLTEWRDARIAWILQPDFKTSQGKILSRESVAAKCAVIYDELRSVYGPNASDNPELTHFAQFVESQHWMAVKDATGNKTHALASSLTDAQYLESIRPYIQFPKLLVSREFLTALEHPATYAKALDMIENHNQGVPPKERWLAVAYRSQFILSVDRTTYGRLLIVAPGQVLADGSAMEQWIQFALATPNTPPSAVLQSVSLIARVRKGDQTRAYFVDMLRNRDASSGEYSLSSTFSMKPMPSSNCFNCHKTAVLPIHPKALLSCNRQGITQETETFNPTVATINAMALKNRGPESLFVDPASYGPSLGDGPKENLDRALSIAAKETGATPDETLKVRAAMVCASCHGRFAPLNFDLSVSTDRDASSFESKLGLAQTYVQNGTMPPGNGLTPNERKLLWAALSRAYFDPKTGTGTIVDWLKGK